METGNGGEISPKKESFGNGILTWIYYCCYYYYFYHYYYYCCCCCCCCCCRHCFETITLLLVLLEMLLPLLCLQMNLVLLKSKWIQGFLPGYY